MGNCGLQHPKKFNRQLCQQPHDTESYEGTHHSRRKSLKPQLKFVLNDEDLLLSTTKYNDENVNATNFPSFPIIDHDHENITYSANKIKKNPLDTWVQHLTSISDQEQDIIFSDTDSETDCDHNDFESKCGERPLAKINTNISREKIFHSSKISSPSNILIMQPMTSYTMSSPSQLPDGHKPNLYRPYDHHSQDSYNWDSSDMEDLENEMKHELECRNSPVVSVLNSPVIPPQNPAFHQRKSSNLVQSLTCDWDMQVLELEEVHMRKYLSHLRENEVLTMNKTNTI